MTRITVTPAEFTLVKFDAGTLQGLAERSAKAVDFPADVDVLLDVDEVLPAPLIGSYADVVDGKVSLWFTGGSFEDSRYQGQIHEVNASTELAAAFLRGRDRLSGGFADAPTDQTITERQRAVWDVYTEGRLVRLGFEVREPRRRYTFRLHCGFNDVADAEYVRLWGADDLTWSDVEETAAKLEAADSRPVVKKQVLRRETLRDTT